MTDQAQEHVRRIAEWCGWVKNTNWRQTTDDPIDYVDRSGSNFRYMTREGNTLTPAGAIAALEGAYEIAPHLELRVIGDGNVSITFSTGPQWRKTYEGRPCDAIRDALGQALTEGK